MLDKQKNCDSLQPQLCGLDWVTRKSWPRIHTKSSAKLLTIVDLFSSCGGMTLGAWEGSRLSRRQLSVRLAVELMEEPLNVYQSNFSKISKQIVKDDIRNLFNGDRGATLTATEKSWKKKVGKLDLLVAGPPCQGHSDLNNSTRRNDPRNLLYLRVIRAAEVLMPQAIIIENVPAVQHDRGNVISMAQSWLQELGYRVSTSVIQFSRFGVPQSRKRHILLAVSKGGYTLSDIEKVNCVPSTLGDYLKGLEESANSNGLLSRPARMTKRNIERVQYLFENNLYDLPNSERPPCHRDKKHAYVSMYGRMRWNQCAQTLTSGFGSMGQGRYIHPKKQRLITPHEAARLQGIPDFFDFTAAQTLSGLREMIANAVPPPFTATLVNRLIGSNSI
ncbi:DNA cytosine methyltransferase [Gimesia chilikensis]|uniref:DNA cytosine methyltransferase n=1 Tax=Gimesia chilikensis TaxID=2605989 RepID=UPI00118C22CC|nr:DNA cytosine methyltransferase [Gimesia chilikensis]QDT83065.1 putative BsuMI modification methylase subunit YdiO [Gimesia chilikensis]